MLLEWHCLFMCAVGLTLGRCRADSDGDRMPCAKIRLLARVVSRRQQKIMRSPCRYFHRRPLSPASAANTS
jgi:hypothetical protein